MNVDVWVEREPATHWEPATTDCDISDARVDDADEFASWEPLELLGWPAELAVFVYAGLRRGHQLSPEVAREVIALWEEDIVTAAFEALREVPDFD